MTSPSRFVTPSDAVRTLASSRLDCGYAPDLTTGRPRCTTRLRLESSLQRRIVQPGVSAVSGRPDARPEAATIGGQGRISQAGAGWVASLPGNRTGQGHCPVASRSTYAQTAGQPAEGSTEITRFILTGCRTGTLGQSRRPKALTARIKARGQIPPSRVERKAPIQPRPQNVMRRHQWFPPARYSDARPGQDGDA